jgi:hypothetical protein
MTCSSPTNHKNNFLPLTLSLSHQGRGKFIRDINLYPLPLGDCVIINEKLLPLQEGTGGWVTKL